ncbi:hypothetical protein LCGC14_1497810 [marine sediment metagenome]|uniref:Uncharacterized protein n=1 Tax=marine sediment metagenome TaxID=412755 RepID=A0A0F9J5K0_9ZZZZ
MEELLQKIVYPTSVILLSAFLIWFCAKKLPPWIKSSWTHIDILYRITRYRPNVNTRHKPIEPHEEEAVCKRWPPGAGERLFELCGSGRLWEHPETHDLYICKAMWRILHLRSIFWSEKQTKLETSPRRKYSLIWLLLASMFSFLLGMGAGMTSLLMLMANWLEFSARVGY